MVIIVEKVEKEKMKPLELVSINLKSNDLLFTKHFIDSLGGKHKAKSALLDIIDRYFNTEHIDYEIFKDC